MANTRSSKKDLRRIAKRRVQNLATKSSLKTFVKKARASGATGDAKAAKDAVTAAASALDKAQQRGVIHKNQAARRKSRAAKAANKALASAVAAPAPAPKKAKKQA